MITKSRDDSRSVRGATLGVGVLFASNGALFAAMLPWYPLISGRLALTATQFGLIVASFAIGAIASSALPFRLIARFGPVRVSLLGTVVLAGAVAAVGWIGAGWAFALALFIAGFVDAIVDVAQKVAGVRVQDAAGRPILSSMHGLWSLGGVASGALSTASAANGVDIRLHLASVGVIGIAFVTLGGRLIGRLADNPPTTPSAASAPAAQRWRALTVAAAPLVIIAICGAMIEDIANNWAALSGVQLVGLDATVSGIAFTVAIGSQCVGRFSGDMLIQRFGAARVARIGGVLVAFGGLLIVTAAHPVLFLAGLVMAGYGSATLVPSAFNAAARLPGIGQGGGVTIISWLMRTGFLATSPVIGIIADSAGLHWGLGLLILIGATAAALAGSLERKDAA